MPNENKELVLTWSALHNFVFQRWFQFAIGVIWQSLVVCYFQFVLSCIFNCCVLIYDKGGYWRSTLFSDWSLPVGEYFLSIFIRLLLFNCRFNWFNWQFFKINLFLWLNLVGRSLKRWLFKHGKLKINTRGLLIFQNLTIIILHLVPLNFFHLKVLNFYWVIYVVQHRDLLNWISYVRLNRQIWL